jgi:signal transduction histidine kinase
VARGTGAGFAYPTPYSGTTSRMALQGHEIRAGGTYAGGMSPAPARRVSTLASRVPVLAGRVQAVLAAGVTEPPTPRWPRLRFRGLDLVFLADAAAALILFAISNSILANDNSQHHSPHSTGLIVLASAVLCAPLLLRTRLPLTAWTFSTVAMFWVSQVIPPYSISNGAYVNTGVVVYILCLYAVALRCKAWVVISAGLVTVFGAAIVASQSVVTAVFLGAIPVAAGVIVRSRRGSREQLAVVERRHEGERALLEERQRIARELHDVVAHHMSVIAIQAEAAPYRSADPPPELVESFAEIRASALSGLNELRRVLGVLRSERADVAPQPGLEDLDELLESARTGGVTVAREISGTPRPLPDGVNLSAYRIVQEALSNAIRHAPGSAVQVKLYYGEAALVIEVRNDAGAAGPLKNGEQPAAAALGNGGGHGIIGMRERATMLGGSLRAGLTPDQEFLVTAALPLGDGAGEDAP